MQTTNCLSIEIKDESIQKRLTRILGEVKNLRDRRIIMFMAMVMDSFVTHSTPSQDVVDRLFNSFQHREGPSVLADKRLSSCKTIGEMLGEFGRKSIRGRRKHGQQKIYQYVRDLIDPEEHPEQARAMQNYLIALKMS